MLLFTRGAMGFQFQSIAAFGPLIGRDLALTPGQTGGLIGMYLLPGAVMAIPGSVLGQWLGGKRAALVALALMGAGGFALAASASFAEAALARLAAGAGMVLLNVLLTKMVADRFRGRESATAMALLLVMWPVGIALALATLGGLASATSWRVAANVTGAWPLAALIGMAALYADMTQPAEAERPAAALSRAPAPGAMSAIRPRVARTILLGSAAGLAWTPYNCGFTALISFTPALLAFRGASLAQAGLISSFIVWGAMAGTPSGGVFADATRKPRPLVLFASLSGAALIALAYAGNSIVHLFAMGFCVCLPTGPLMAMLGEALPERERGLGYGVLLSWYYLGVGATPALAGLLQEWTGTPESILPLSAALVLATFPAYWGFHRLLRQLQG